MEIIVLPYMAVSFAIAWAVFSPFAQIDDLEEWTFARIETSDLLAVFLPLGLLFAMVTYAIPVQKLPIWAIILLAAIVLSFVLFAFSASLYVLAKMNRPTSFKRMAIVGVIIPLGALLTFIWILFPLWAYASSMLYAIPATLAIVPATLFLRLLSCWVCQSAFIPK